MINDIFVYIAFASIAGGITSATFLIFEKWIYKMTSASYMVFLNGFSILAFILPYYMPVSYTHLDVYKRQAVSLR